MLLSAHLSLTELSHSDSSTQYSLSTQAPLSGVATPSPRVKGRRNSTTTAAVARALRQQNEAGAGAPAGASAGVGAEKSPAEREGLSSGDGRRRSNRVAPEEGAEEARAPAVAAAWAED